MNPQIPVEIMQAISPQARLLVNHMVLHGSVTQREALMDMSIQSLTKRISELRTHFDIVADRRKHKTSGQRYVRYFYKGVKKAEVE